MLLKNMHKSSKLKSRDAIQLNPSSHFRSVLHQMCINAYGLAACTSRKASRRAVQHFLRKGLVYFSKTMVHDHILLHSADLANTWLRTKRI